MAAPDKYNVVSGWGKSGQPVKHACKDVSSLEGMLTEHTTNQEPTYYGN